MIRKKINKRLSKKNKIWFFNTLRFLRLLSETLWFNNLLKTTTKYTKYTQRTLKLFGQPLFSLTIFSKYFYFAENCQQNKIAVLPKQSYKPLNNFSWIGIKLWTKHAVRYRKNNQYNNCGNYCIYRTLFFAVHYPCQHPENKSYQGFIIG